MSDEPEEKKRITPANLIEALAVVATIQVVALLITFQNLPTYQATGPPVSPGGSGATGSAVNVIFYVGFAFAATLLLLFLLRRKKRSSFKALVFTSLAISSFALTFITSDGFFAQYLAPTAGPLAELAADLAVSLAVVGLIGYTIFVKNRPWLSTIVIAFVGAEVGSFFATLPLATALLLPVAFSIYDIYAVFKGPLKSLIGTGEKVALVGMSIRAGEFTLGLGDVVFYTMLPSLPLAQLVANSSSTAVAAATRAAFGTLALIDVGVVVTLFLLSRRRLLPGLPIPMLLGLLVLALYFV
ncbi:MAG: hypothetical protein ACLQEQ_00270 [Nitrososphaerales archaeon]